MPHSSPPPAAGDERESPQPSYASPVASNCLVVVHTEAFGKWLIRSSLADPPSRDPQANLGRLDSLPLEVIWKICRHADIHSLLALKWTNRRGCQVVVSLSGYRLLFQHFTPTLRGVLRTGIARHHSFAQLQEVLYANVCPECGSFAGLLFFPTFSRLCFMCMCKYPDLLLGGRSNPSAHATV